MNYEIISLITKYFNDPDDTIKISHLCRSYYQNRIYYYLNNITKYDTEKHFDFYMQFIPENINLKTIININGKNIYNIKFNSFGVRHKVNNHIKLFYQKIDKFKISRETFDNLTHLIFCDKFNQSINNFPKNLKYLKFGKDFNKKIRKFPNNLTYLIFGLCFNQPIKLFPEKLKYLKFGYYFNQHISNLPINLTHLYFDDSFNQKIDLPTNLVELKFGFDFNKLINLPDNLIKLEFNYCFNQPISKFPNSLKYLKFGKNFNQLISLPDNITILKFGKNFNQPIILPKNLTELDLGIKFDQNIDLSLQKNLIKLGIPIKIFNSKILNELKFLKKIIFKAPSQYDIAKYFDLISQYNNKIVFYYDTKYQTKLIGIKKNMMIL